MIYYTAFSGSNGGKASKFWSQINSNEYKLDNIVLNTNKKTKPKT